MPSVSNPAPARPSATIASGSRGYAIAWSRPPRPVNDNRRPARLRRRSALLLMAWATSLAAGAVLLWRMGGF